MFSYTVRVHPLATPMGQLLGFCDLVIDDRLVVSDFKVFKSKQGDLFVASPSKKSSKKNEKGEDVYFDSVRFIDEKASEDAKRTPLQEEIYAAMLDEFKKAGKATTSTTTAQPTTETKTATRRNPLW